MTENASVIALSLLFGTIFVLTLVLVFICLRHYRRLELERRRRRGIERRELLRLTLNAREQELWRREHLSRVVSILLDRREAYEGIALVLHLPGHGERLTERNVRRLRPQLLRQTDGTMASIPNIVMRARASETPPPEALPGPDLLQLLLVWLTRQRIAAEAEAERSSSSVSVPPNSNAAETLPSAEAVYGAPAPYLPRTHSDGDATFVLVDEGHGGGDGDGAVPGAQARRGLSFEGMMPVEWMREASAKDGRRAQSAASSPVGPPTPECWEEGRKSQHSAAAAEAEATPCGTPASRRSEC
ncbi:uncharacterized protein Tco025E_06661 [Trypanosoma conorhini]|uniref:Uncharacterized protein n=1 Tax=Trypanosoma conorhini TaxID=83891 RepID=A0A422P0Y2_9TRYP|nr:uncharacterized protein Tco025E_06661 [Trypanosoma conorhini]RNF11367.1 hypothetical protein Tco025E_06661 [Trypanosoma conorhini]